MSHTVIVDNNSETIDNNNEKDNVSDTESDTDTDDSISLFSEDETTATSNFRLAPQQGNVRRHQPAPASPRRLRSGRIFANKHRNY